MLVTFRTADTPTSRCSATSPSSCWSSWGIAARLPSAIKAEDVPAALARLEAAIKQRGAANAADPPGSDRGREDYDAPRKVTLSQRAGPLLELLRAAAADKADVMWNA